RYTHAETVVYERHRGVGPGIGLAVNLAPNGMRVLDHLGLADQVIRQGCVLRTWELGHHDGQLITRFALRFERDYGYPMVAIRRDLLVDILRTAAVDAGVDLRFGHQVTGLEQRPGGVRLSLVDGGSEP